jgi:V/A-type H+/Na+-transporting ATPase subunit E
MSDNNSLKIGALDSKIQEISSYLKSSVLDPAEEEKKKLVEEGNLEKERIISSAKEEAAKIIKEAQKETQVLKQNTESALSIAAKQTIDRVKLAIEKEILHFTVEKPVGEAIKSEAVVTAFVSEVIKQYADSKINFSIALGRDVKEKVSAFIEQEIKAKGSEGIKISEENLSSGFSLSFTDNSLRIDFTEEAVIELFTEYLRPGLRETLFNKTNKK